MTVETLPPPAGLPGGWAVRRPRPADVPAVVALVAAVDVAFLGRADAITPSEVVWDMLSQGADLSRNQAVALDEEERVRAWAWLEDRSGGAFAADVYVDPALDPAAGDALARWGWRTLLDRAAEAAAGAGAAEAVVDTGAYLGDEDTERRLAASGFAPARTFWRMYREVGAADADVPMPAGIHIRPVGAGRSAGDTGLRGLHEVYEQAFADHWNHHPETFESWWQRWNAAPDLDLGLWWLAEVDGAPAGLLLSRAEPAAGVLFVDDLGTLPVARRRGVGTALLRRAFAAAARRGLTNVRLNVDSANPTGATRLYERAGMRVEYALRAWQRRQATTA